MFLVGRVVLSFKEFIDEDPENIETLRYMYRTALSLSLFVQIGHGLIQSQHGCCF